MVDRWWTGGREAQSGGREAQSGGREAQGGGRGGHKRFTKEWEERLDIVMNECYNTYRTKEEGKESQDPRFGSRVRPGAGKTLRSPSGSRNQRYEHHEKRRDDLC